MGFSFKKYINTVGSPKIFVYTVIWMMVLVFIGTIVQKDVGLYAAQKKYFSSWFIMLFGFIPLPSGKLTMLVMFLNLSCWLLRHNLSHALKKVLYTT